MRVIKGKFAREEKAQSLVELALSLPLLLLMVMGLADMGRAFYFAIAITDSAREAAAYAARNAGATAADVAQIACNETGFVAHGDPCPASLTITYVAPANDDWDASASVTVTLQMDLISGYLVGRVFELNPVTLRAAASYPLLR